MREFFRCTFSWKNDGGTLAHRGSVLSQTVFTLEETYNLSIQRLLILTRIAFNIFPSIRYKRDTVFQEISFLFNFSRLLFRIV